MLSDGTINSEYAFTKDYIFTSPSLAATIVMGRNANGRTEWKTAEGTTIKQYRCLFLMAILMEELCVNYLIGMVEYIKSPEVN